MTTGSGSSQKSFYFFPKYDSPPSPPRHKDTRNCQEKVNKISHLKPNQLAPSIYIMKELCFFSLDQ